MTRLFLPLMFTLCLLTGCAGHEDGVPRGSGPAITAETSHESEGGIGGTGAPVRKQARASGDEAEGGIGGTGIFGTVTAFGSIVVNGLTVDFSDDVVQSPASIVGQDLPLTVGSAVLVEAGRMGEAWNAQRVALFLPVVGPVSTIDAASSVLEVMGTSIAIDDDTQIVDRKGAAIGETLDLDAIDAGDRLAISGLWKGGEVIASRIDRLNMEGPAGVSGLLLTSGDGAVVGGTVLAAGCCEGLDAPAFVTLSGRYQGNRFEVDDLRTGMQLLFSDRIDQLVVEAFLARDPDGQGFHLSGFGIPADQSATVAVEPGVRSLFVGRYDGAFSIRNSVPLPADRSARIETFRSLDSIAIPD